MTFATWQEARAYAEAQARKMGVAHGVERPTTYEPRWLSECCRARGGNSGARLEP